EDRIKELSFDDASWGEINVPGVWEDQGLEGLDGAAWMRKTVMLSADDIKNKAILSLAKVDEIDITYINGIEIGSGRQYNVKRVYEIPANVLKAGKNVIAVKVIDNVGNGGIYDDTADLKLTLGNKDIPLKGKWKYKVVSVQGAVSP